MGVVVSHFVRKPLVGPDALVGRPVGDVGLDVVAPVPRASGDRAETLATIGVSVILGIARRRNATMAPMP